MGLKAGANSVELRRIKQLALGDEANGIEPLTAEVISKMMRIKLENVQAIVASFKPAVKKAPKKAPEPKTVSSG